MARLRPVVGPTDPPAPRPSVVSAGDPPRPALDGLRVVDASVVPTMPTVNPMVTVLMIGERAADLIKGAAG